MTDDTVMLGGKGGSRGTGSLDTIGSVTDQRVAEDEVQPTLDNAPIGITVGRRISASYAVGQRIGSLDPGTG